MGDELIRREIVGIEFLSFLQGMKQLTEKCPIDVLGDQTPDVRSRTPRKFGILYGVGVGPGDPDLLTIKALEVLRDVPFIFAASSSKNDYSIAGNIVKKHLGSKDVEKLPFPMCDDKSVLEEAWKKNGDRVLEVLSRGLDCAFITLGDPLTYSTFSYLLKTIRKVAPGIRVRSVPGITSFQAAAAAASLPLSEGEESLVIVSGARGGLKLKESIKTSDNIVMLKTYKQFKDIYQTLEELDLLNKATFVCNLGTDEQKIVNDLTKLKDANTPYLSLIIIKKNLQDI